MSIAIAAVGVGHREERMAEDQDEGVHVRVDVAEDAHDAGAIEATDLRVAGGVAPEVERLRLREREHVVVEAVGVGKVDRRAGHDREHVRHERLVALIHHARGRLRGLSNAPRGADSRYTTERRRSASRRAAPASPRSATPGRRSIGGARARQLDAAADRSAPRAPLRRRRPPTARTGSAGTRRRDGSRTAVHLRTRTPAAPRQVSVAARGRRRAALCCKDAFSSRLRWIE